MEHEQLKKNLFALYDGELSGIERREVLVHIEECPECRQACTDWDRIAKTFFRPNPQQVPEALVQKVMRGVDPLRAPGWIRWRPAAIRWLTPVLGLGVALLLFFIGVAGQETVISTEALLLVNGPEGSPSQWVLIEDPPEADDLLAIVLEGS